MFTERGNDVTIFLLIKAIQTFLENELVDDAFAVPNVYLGDLPPNSADSQEDPEYPFIIIRPFEGEGGKDNIQSQIKLLFRTRPRDNSGFIDLLNLMERVRILLMRQGILKRNSLLMIAGNGNLLRNSQCSNGLVKSLPHGLYRKLNGR